MKKRQLFKTKTNEELKIHFENKEALRKTRAEYKLIKRANKAIEKKRKNEIKEKQKWFHFFTKWFFLGIIFVITSFCISIISESTDGILQSFLIVASGVLSTIGISLFVGCVFDFSKNSEAFVTFVSKILSDIVVSKTFLSSLSIKDKEQALNLILKPEKSQIEQYANINEFFKKRIKEAMTMFDTNFKTNLTLDIEAKKDKVKNIVICESTLTYTAYKLNDKFVPLELVFEKEGSSSDKIEIISPDGKVKTKDEVESFVTMGGIQCTKHILTFPEECEKYDHLTVRRTFTEPGKDHWINYIWQSLTPYEGMSCRVKCQDGLTIKDYMIFDNKTYYHVDKSDDGQRIDITSSQWLDADTGFSFVISE